MTVRTEHPAGGRRIRIGPIDSLIHRQEWFGKGGNRFEKAGMCIAQSGHELLSDEAERGVTRIEGRVVDGTFDRFYSIVFHGYLRIVIDIRISTL